MGNVIYHTVDCSGSYEDTQMQSVQVCVQVGQQSKATRGHRSRQTAALQLFDLSKDVPAKSASKETHYVSSQCNRRRQPHSRSQFKGWKSGKSQYNFSVHCVCLNVGRKCSMLLGFQTFGCQYCGADFSDRHSHQQHIKLHVLGEFYLSSCCTKSTSCRPVQTPHCCFHRSTALINHVTCC